MSSQKHIEDELRSLESSLPVNNNQPLSVPEGYFDGLAAAVMAKIKGNETSVQAELDQLSPLLAGIPKQTPYSVPSSYFEQNADDILLISQEPTSDILSSIGKSIPYSLPEGYFASLPAEMLVRVSEPKVKVVPLFARTWMRIATAAAVAGALFLGGYQLLRNNEGDDLSTASQVTTAEQSQLANNTQPIEKEIKKVSTQELEEFIENVQANSVKAADTEKSSTNNNDVETLLKDVSTGEMESFLSDLPTADDELLVTN